MLLKILASIVACSFNLPFYPVFILIYDLCVLSTWYNTSHVVDVH